MTSDLMPNPLKMAPMGSSALGNLSSVIPPISSVPASKKEGGGTKPKNQTFYNAQVNTHNTLLDMEKGGGKMMMQTLTQKPVFELDVDPVPALLQNARNSTTIPTRNTTADSNKGSLKVASGDGGDAQKFAVHEGVEVVPAQQQQQQQTQNFRNSLLDSGKRGLIREPDMLGQKMMGVEVVPTLMQNTHNMILKDPTSLKKDTKSPLKTTKQLGLGKFSKGGKGKNVLDVIKITGGPPLSPEFVGSKSLGVGVQAYKAVPSPVSSANNFPGSTPSPTYMSPASTPSPTCTSTSAGSTEHPPKFPTSVHGPSNVAPTSSVSSTDNPLQFPDSTPSPATSASPATSGVSNPPIFPVSQRTSRAGSETDSALTGSGSYSDSRDEDEEEEEEEGSDSSESGSESEATLTSTGGPLVEYTGSYTHTDDLRQHTASPDSDEGEGDRLSLSSRDSGEEEEEEDGDDTGRDSEMPELEEVPETEKTVQQLAPHTAIETKPRVWSESGHYYPSRKGTQSFSDSHGQHNNKRHASQPLLQASTGSRSQLASGVGPSAANGKHHASSLPKANSSSGSRREQGMPTTSRHDTTSTKEATCRPQKQFRSSSKQGFPLSVAPAQNSSHQYSNGTATATRSGRQTLTKHGMG
jgi:hypothetical protein